MTPEAFAAFAICLEYLPSGTAPAWGDGAARFYFATLSDVPDEAVPVLMKAVGTHFRFRPTPSEVLDVWHRVSDPAPRYTPDSLVSSVRQLVHEYGECAAPMPGFERRWPNLRAPGPPPGLTPEQTRLVAAWGGWAPFCQDDSPMGVRTGQLMKVAEAVCRSAADRDIDDLRLEYAEARRQLEIERGQLPDYDGPDDPFADNGPVPLRRETGGMVPFGPLALRELGR